MSHRLILILILILEHHFGGSTMAGPGERDHLPYSQET